MRALFLLPPTLLLISCDEPAPAPSKMTEAERIAAVHQAAMGPVFPVQPQPITTAEMRRGDLAELPCTFVSGATGEEALVKAGERSAYIKVKGKLLHFSSDTGSAPQPLGAWSKYDGLEMSLRLNFRSESGEEAEDSVAYPAQFELRDIHDRVTYEAIGTARCKR